ncbi:MAG: prepilin peptidase [Planctomycetaceae bacterium]
MTPLLLAVAAAFGAIVGSFLNVVIYRLPRGEGVGAGRSKCPACRRVIPWHDNIPVVSWLLLRARCRACGGPISFRYPLVEAMTAAVFLLTALRVEALGWDPPLLAFLVCSAFASVVLAASFIDLDHKILPDKLTLRAGPAVALVGAVGVPAIHGQSFWGIDLSTGMKPGLASLLVGLAGALVGGGVILLIRQLGSWMMRKEAMGLGDVKFMAMCGLLLGPGPVLLAIWGAILLAALLGAGIWIVTRNREIPFGPFLGLGALAVLYFGPSLGRFLLVDLPSRLRGG